MKRKIFSILFALVMVLTLGLVTATPVSAATLTVDTSLPDTPPNYHTIQAAVDAASPGETIIVAAGTYPEYLHITTDGLTIQGAGIDQSIIDLDGLTPYWHYSPNKSFASRAGVLITGWGSPDDIIEGVTFKGFTVKNAGLNPPITATGTHTGADNVSMLTDSTATFTAAVLGQWVHNVSDKLIAVDISGNTPIRSYGEITAHTTTTVTATLAGGLDNDWDNGDTYVIMPYEEYVDVAEDLQDDVRGIAVSNGKNVLIQYCKVINSGYAGITVGKARRTTLAQSEGVTIDNCISSDNPQDGISVGSYIGPITITNNVCSNNKSPHPTDPSREYGGKGIEVSGRNASNLISGLISGNTCNDNGFEGIVLKNYSDGVIVENNIVTGSNFDQDGAGIFFYGKSSNPAYCKNNVIRNNTVTGNIRGIVAYYAQACTIEGNTITTDSGTFPLGQAAIKIDGGNNITVKNNTISCDGAGIKVQKTWNDVDCYGNTFTGNTITGAKFAGVFISNGAHDNTFTCNTITGTTSLTLWAGKPYEETQADGVFLGDDAGTGNVFHHNKIYCNADDGMENQVTTTTVDAENNWWGDASGPGGVGPGSGDAVSADVDYDPWLIMSYTGPTLFPVGVSVVLEAKMTDSDLSLSGLNVGFYVDDDYVGTNTTDTNGIATFGIGSKDVGVYTIYATTNCMEVEALVAVYDPSAGFVTGGGWIMSPAGAYTPDTNLTGKATFGFVSKYKKGANVPTGNTEFNFRVADLKFHSDSYDWLVITGSNKAMFKGTGTINGAGDYGFMLSAIDGDPDMFRIKIWDKATDCVIYDNGCSGPDGTEIGGGQIVVHKK